MMFWSSEKIPLKVFKLLVYQKLKFILPMRFLSYLFMEIEIELRKQLEQMRHLPDHMLFCKLYANTKKKMQVFNQRSKLENFLLSTWQDLNEQPKLETVVSEWLKEQTSTSLFLHWVTASTCCMRTTLRAKQTTSLSEIPSLLDY